MYRRLVPLVVEGNFGLASASANGGGVAFFAHVSGFVFGALLTLSHLNSGRVVPAEHLATSPRPRTGAMSAAETTGDHDPTVCVAKATAAARAVVAETLSSCPGPTCTQTAEPLIHRAPVLFVNPKSGGGKAARAGLAERARERGIDVIVLRPDDDLAALVDDAVARGADALGVAGGDGSLAVVAAAALAHGLPFVCVPAGTRNHFALDVGVDRGDLVGSLDAFTDGVERRIDVAEVNGRLFLNNVSLGIYGDAVRQPAYRDAKARTLLETAAQRARAERRRQPA